MTGLVLDVSGILAEMAAKLQGAADHYPATAFDGRVSLPVWLAESARAQADCVFLVLDATPVERRDLGWAEDFVRESGMAFLNAWGQIMAAFGTDAEQWAATATTGAVQAYHDRLNKLAPTLHAGGRA